MRNLVIILLVIFSGCNNKKNVAEIGKVEIVPTYCKYENNENMLTPKFKLFKKGDKSTEIKLTEENKVPGKKSLIIPKLEYGDYFIEYITIYNQKNVIEFKINQPQLKIVKLCFDYIEYQANKNVLLIDELKNGESLVLNFSDVGCFDGDKKPIILKIIKADNKIVADYKGAKYNLSNSQIQLFREFEIELRCNHSYGCTTVDTYGISNLKTYESHVFTDGSCQWRGFDNLVKLLDLKS